MERYGAIESVLRAEIVELEQALDAAHKRIGDLDYELHHKWESDTFCDEKVGGKIGYVPYIPLAKRLEQQLADAQATVEALQKKYDDLLGKYRQLVDFYDKHNGTPCEQIRHQQQVEALQAQVRELEESRDAWRASQECSEKAYMALVNQIPAERFDYDPVNVALLDGAKEQEIIGRKQIADLQDLLKRTDENREQWRKLCQEAQSQLTQRTAELEALQRERDEAKEMQRSMYQGMANKLSELKPSHHPMYRAGVQEIIAAAFNGYQADKAQPVLLSEWQAQEICLAKLQAALDAEREKLVAVAKERDVQCTLKQNCISMLEQEREKVKGLEAQNTEWERKCRDLCLAHGPLLIEHHDVKRELTQLQALVRAEEVADGKTE